MRIDKVFDRDYEEKHVAYQGMTFSDRTSPSHAFV
jgi:hypothetical protein|tara:strand:- start:286 stop:390 length:105 start_codon:yes stop_codon:yes gene_type:complete